MLNIVIIDHIIFSTYLNNKLTMREYMSIDPHTLINDKFSNVICLLIFLSFFTFNNAPESLTGSVTVLTPGTGAYCQLWWIFYTF